MIELLIALLALISSWFHPIAPPAPVQAPAAISEAPVSTPEAPAEIAPVVPSAEPTPEYANWMEALLPQVDPTHIGVWHFERRGAWGASDGVNIYIDPNSPEDKHFSILAHELGHDLQARYYGSLDLARQQVSIEQQADCIALELKAIWINYGCPENLKESAHAVIEGK